MTLSRAELEKVAEEIKSLSEADQLRMAADLLERGKQPGIRRIALRIVEYVEVKLRLDQ